MWKSSKSLGSVSALYLRPDKTLPPTECHALSLISGKGVDSDCHAHPLSPRQVLITSSSTYAQLDLPANTLRENILLNLNLEFDHEPLESGDTISLDTDGKPLTLRIMFQCEPCGRLNKTKPNLCRDIKGQRGWLARVVESGILRKGDQLKLTKNIYPHFSEDWHERVIFVAHRLPENRSLSYTRLALLAGVAKGYCRAFPRLLRAHADLPTERIVPSSINLPPLPEWNGEDLFNPEPDWNFGGDNQLNLQLDQKL